MTRMHTLLCIVGLGAGVLVALVLGAHWGTILSVAALLACPAAMLLGMRRMAARPGAGQGMGGQPSSLKSHNTDADASETRQAR